MSDGGPCLATPGCTGSIEDGYCSVCGRIDARRMAVLTVERPVARGNGAAVASPAQPQEHPYSAQPGEVGPATTGTTGTAGTSGTTGTDGSYTADSRSSGSGSRSGPGSSRRTVATSRRTTVRSRIGAGLVTVAPMPTLDPSAAVMAVAEVAEDKRFCGKCGSEVGRGRDSRAGRVTGFCSKCRQPYSFLPPLSQDDLVAGQYRIAGCLAYGGLGWIYLAQDEQVSHRWVVLKGLLNSGDHDAMVAALAERQFLAQVEHPNVVRIYNFVQQGDSGYIVMEYVGGKPLKEVLRERRQAGLALPGQLEEGVLPVEHAIAYILAIMPAFSYLHRRGLVYNDFKPDNVMLQGDDVKLIDLGAVTRMDDTSAPIYGTDGYQAPEVARLGPSPASDLYSVARCLAVLVLDFRGYQSKHRYSLPDAGEHPVLARYESLHRFLLKGTAENPDDRFQTAEEMSEQLLGVLREVVAKKEGVPRPTASNLFGGDLQALGLVPGGPALADWRHLPAPRVNPADPAAAMVVNVAALPDPADQVTQLRRALGQGLVPESTEAHLGQARALIWLGDGEHAEAHLEAVNRQDPWDWRVTWYRGVRMLSIGDAAAARQAFERIGFDLPGELAPKLAEALAAELGGDLPRAAQLFDTVSSADPNYTSACFGLARVRAAMGDRAGAVEAYGRVPEESILHVAAQVAMARALIRRGAGTGPGPGLEELLRAGQTVERLRLDRQLRAQLTIELLETALDLVTMQHWRDPGVDLLRRPLVEVEVRLGLERGYRELARNAVGEEKVHLVDRANQHRPLTAV